LAAIPSLSKRQVRDVLTIVETLESEFPHEWDMDEMEQESLEVALDDVIIKLVKAKLLKRKFAKDRTFARAFASLFGEESSLVNLAKKLQLSTSEYTDEFSPYEAKASLARLTSALEEAIDDAPEEG
jgi:hypothetical protein